MGRAARLQRLLQHAGRGEPVAVALLVLVVLATVVPPLVGAWRARRARQPTGRGDGP